MKPLAILVALSLAAPLALADPASPPTRISATEVKLGQPFTVDIEVPSGSSWHPKPLPGGSPFTVLGAHQNGSRVSVELGLYALGAQPLPALTLVSEKGQELQVPAPGTVTARSSLNSKDAALRPLAGPRVPKVIAWRLLVLLGAGALAVLALLAVATTVLVRRWRSPDRGDRRALEKLLAANIDDLAFYVQLDALVRRHLARRHAIPALERTSAELDDDLAARPELPSTELHALFEQADLVKFADRPARAEQRAADGQLALRLLTQPVRRGASGHALP